MWLGINCCDVLVVGVVVCLYQGMQVGCVFVDVECVDQCFFVYWIGFGMDGVVCDLEICDVVCFYLWCGGCGCWYCVCS